MFKMMKKSSKGFTLVEMIVVLVILAIMAALLIPGMTKWIDKAKEKSTLVAARTAVLAAQTIMSEHYGDSAAALSIADVETLADLGTDLDITAVSYSGGNIVFVAGTYKSVNFAYTPAGGYVLGTDAASVSAPSGSTAFGA